MKLKLKWLAFLKYYTSYLHQMNTTFSSLYVYEKQAQRNQALRTARQLSASTQPTAFVQTDVQT